MRHPFLRYPKDRLLQALKPYINSATNGEKVTRSLQQFNSRKQADESMVRRARKYLNNHSGAIEGLNGSGDTFRVACVLLHKFKLSIDQALCELETWNQKCVPPWPLKDLKHKLHDAATKGSVADAERPTSRLIVRKASDVKIEKVVSLDSLNLLICSVITLLLAIPGYGKSTLGAYCAACLSRGIVPFEEVVFPGAKSFRKLKGKNIPPVATIVIQFEESTAHSSVPKLIAMRADLDLIHFVDGVAKGGFEKAFGTDDLEALESLVAETGAKLIIIDPIKALDFGDSNDHDKVLRVMLRLKQFAQRTGVANLAITHPSKDEKKSVTNRYAGSGAFIQVARNGWVIGKDPEDSESRLLAHDKASMTARSKSVKFRIVGTNVTANGQSVSAAAIKLEGMSDATAEQALDDYRRRPLGRRPGPVNDAQAVIIDTLANGPVLSDVLNEELKNAGVTVGTGKSAKKALGVVKAKERGQKMNSRWWSKLPDQQFPWETIK